MQTDLNISVDEFFSQYPVSEIDIHNIKKHFPNLQVENDYGSFLCFDALTLVPFERSAIIAEELSTKEKEWLNKYHQKVFETIAPYLTEEEAGWLREETQEF